MRVVELFAGVGGFRLGLERAGGFDTVWFNQWEPSTKVQHAYQCYLQHFPHEEGLHDPTWNMDITQVPTKAVPEHDVLVGGFPCQDYSVATTLDKAGGLQGRKGVLWWEINRILEHRRPPYVVLENVDRLLRSPADQRGRDLGILLGCLRDWGYRAEWRVINAADYGNAQRRRRVFIFAAHRSTGIGRHMAKAARLSNYLVSEGFFPQRFPVNYELLEVDEAPVAKELPDDVRDISEEFSFNFLNAGVMVDGEIRHQKVGPRKDPEAWLIKHLEKDGVDEEFYLDMSRLDDWRAIKGPKKLARTAKNGHSYHYAEGGMQFPDLHKTPARTILTSEANRTPNRSTHVVEDPKTGRLRFLTPLECERLNGFDDGWTKDLPRRWRYFTMGNALVVPVVTRIGEALRQWIREHEPKTRRGRLLPEEGPAVVHPPR